MKSKVLDNYENFHVLGSYCKVKYAVEPSNVYWENLPNSFLKRF